MPSECKMEVDDECLESAAGGRSLEKAQWWRVTVLDQGMVRDLKEEVKKSSQVPQRQ